MKTSKLQKLCSCEYSDTMDCEAIELFGYDILEVKGQRIRILTLQVPFDVILNHCKTCKKYKKN